MYKFGLWGVSLLSIFWATTVVAADAVQLHCTSKDAGFSVSIEIDGENLLLDGRETVSDFKSQTINFVDEKLGDFFHVLDRVTGELAIYDSNSNKLLGVMRCKKVKSLQF